MMLIACLLTFTASSQNDSTYCFTKSQVKTFLTTKVELNNCEGQFALISDSLSVITTDNTKLQKKVRRNRNIALGAGGGLIAVIILWLGIK